MKEAGINFIRIAEFAWSRMEPQEGLFTLDWLHECVEVMAKYGIDVQMCTPTSAPPAWLTQYYPQVSLICGDGRPYPHGARHHICRVTPEFRRHTARVVTKLAEEMSRHKNVVAWQIDNEFGPERGWCHCEHCQMRFRQWLRERYGTIENLCEAWKTGFWSVDFSDWGQIRLDARPNPPQNYSSLRLDTQRFRSDMMVENAKFQADILRRKHPRAIVSTNGMGPIYRPINYYDLFGILDVACVDLYFDIASMSDDTLSMNNFRGMKPGKRYWVTETGSGALTHHKPPQPGQFRAWAWSSWAHGADAHLVFRWRTCLSGQEQELQGILEHSGKPRHRYREVKACFTEMAKFRKAFANLPLPAAEVALVQSYDSLWGSESAQVAMDANGMRVIRAVHDELYTRNIMTDIIAPEHDLSKYKLVILPSTVILSETLIASLQRFVQRGGVVFAMGQIGIRDRNDNYFVKPGPEGLQALFGMTLEGGMYLASFCGTEDAIFFPEARHTEHRIPVKGKLGKVAAAGAAETWLADIEAHTAKVLMKVQGDSYDGQPAVTQNRYGKGVALYAGACRWDAALTAQLVDYALELAKVRHGVKAPRNVEVIRRGDTVFAINHGTETVTLSLEGAKGKSLVGDFADGVATLPPYGVTVVKM